MVLFFTFILLIIVAVCCVIIYAEMLKKRTNTVAHYENVAESFEGVPKVVHDNASKTVESSMLGATDTLSSFGIESLNMNSFYDSLNKKKEQ